MGIFTTGFGVSNYSKKVKNEENKNLSRSAICLLLPETD